MAGRTVLLITHRLAALEDRFDEVLVMEGGRVVERGSPGELMSTGGLYAHYQDYLIERPDDRELTLGRQPHPLPRPPLEEEGI